MMGTICKRLEREALNIISADSHLGQRAELIAEEYTAVFELAAVLIGNGEYLSIELLDNQRDHKEGIWIFLRHDYKDSRLLIAEGFGIYLGIKAQELL